MGRALSLSSLILLLGLVAAPGPLAAHWLVTTGGARLETDGPWEIRGRLVVFRLAKGGLSSLPVSEVDLEASELATAESRRPSAKSAPAASERPRRAVLVLTDADVSHGPSEPDDSASSAARGADPDRGAESPQRLEVTAWTRADDPQVDGLTITGRVRNTSTEVTAATTITVRIYDHEGGLIAASGATLGATILAPGRATHFRADFPSVFSFSAVRFETGALAVETAVDDSDGARIRPDELPTGGGESPPPGQ